MKMVPFTRNVFESGRFKFKVSYISGLVLDKNGDILKPYFEGTDNDVIFIMHYGFITTCKLEDVLRAFDRRRVVNEAILSNEIVLGKKGMELACEQLPYANSTVNYGGTRLRPPPAAQRGQADDRRTCS
eukprot:jgi/Tetstr1/449577/TSEL_036664.t1